MFMRNVLVSAASKQRNVPTSETAWTFSNHSYWLPPVDNMNIWFTKMLCHISQCGIPGRQTGAGTGFLFHYFSFPLSLAFHQHSTFVPLPQMLYNLRNGQHHSIQHTHTMPATSAVRNFMWIWQTDVISGHLICLSLQWMLWFVKYSPVDVTMYMIPVLGTWLYQGLWDIAAPVGCSQYEH
jgi:hypothetical protein